MSPVSRLASLDALRGLIIVLMAIDHARGFIARNHPSEFWGSPLPDYQGDWVAFLTRLVTHLCAPGFMSLMGAGAALFATSRDRAGWSPVRIAGQLALRGLVLIVVGQLLENTAAAFGSAGATRAVTYGLRVPGAPGPIPLILGVLYGLGSALVVAAPLVRLPTWALVALSGACSVLLRHPPLAVCRHRPVLSGRDDDSADVSVLVARSGPVVPAVPVVWRLF